MEKSRKGFKKASNLVEITVFAHDSYQACTEKACSVLKMHMTTAQKAVLLRMSGSIIPDKPLGEEAVWTIGQYVEQVFSTRSAKHFGIAVIEDVSKNV